MFKNIIELIEDEKYAEAEKSLIDIETNGEDKEKAYSSYLLGYINTVWRNKDKDENRARRYLLKHINSDYPLVHAYVLYADVEEDNNIAEGYLKKGLKIFPNEPKLLYKLLNISRTKEEVIALIRESETTNFDLLCGVIEELIRGHKWEQIGSFIFLLESNNELTEYQKNYLDLLKGFSLAFSEKQQYDKAAAILSNVADYDIDNTFGYAHYIGIIYSFINLGQLDMALKYFDKLPINDSVFDLFDGPNYFITVWFEKEYETAFRAIEYAFEDDQQRKSKARCLYSLYLYHPSASFDIYRYNEKDIENLKTELLIKYNKFIASALFNMYSHFEDFKSANLVYLNAICNGDDLEKTDAYYSTAIENVGSETIIEMTQDVINLLEKCESFYRNVFIENCFGIIVRELHENEQYPMIVKLSEFFTIKEIMLSDESFYVAYAYTELSSDKGFEIYTKILENEPQNTSVLNNLGLIYEQKNLLEKATDCFEKAQQHSPDERHLRNLQRVRGKIENISRQKQVDKQKEYRAIVKNVNYNYFQKIGYTEELISKFNNIADVATRDILQRDLRECAVAIATKQNKLATIMVGSIIEAILYLKLKEKRIVNYLILKGNKTKKIPTHEMALNELLFVAESEKLLCKNDYHLSHYVRDFRNLIHPAKEIKSNMNITHDNVLIMWSILKQLINDLF